jgi:hypothetical protein
MIKQILRHSRTELYDIWYFEQVRYESYPALDPCFYPASLLMTLAPGRSGKTDTLSVNRSVDHDH